MASVAMLVGGALVNALAFSGPNYLFSMLKGSGVDAERKCHDKAVEQLRAAQAEWSPRRTERLDWINEELRRQNHAVQTFRDVDPPGVALGMAATGNVAYEISRQSRKSNK